MTTTAFTGRRIEPLDLETSAPCLSFLDQCAAEAASERWFIVMAPRSTLCERVYEALCSRPYGATSTEVGELVGHERSATEKALRVLLEDGRARIASKRKWARVYEAVTT